MKLSAKFAHICCSARIYKEDESESEGRNLEFDTTMVIKSLVDIFRIFSSKRFTSMNFHSWFPFSLSCWLPLSSIHAHISVAAKRRGRNLYSNSWNSNFSFIRTQEKMIYWLRHFVSDHLSFSCKLQNRQQRHKQKSIYIYFLTSISISRVPNETIKQKGQNRFERKTRKKHNHTCWLQKRPNLLKIWTNSMFSLPLSDQIFTGSALSQKEKILPIEF